MSGNFFRYTAVSLLVLVLGSFTLSGRSAGRGLGAADSPQDTAFTRSFRNDTVSLRLTFDLGEATVNRRYDGNGDRIESFRQAYNRYVSNPETFASGVFIRVGTSPEGQTASNIELSRKRMENVREFICHEFGISPFNVYVTSDGESWSELAGYIRALDVPWKASALKIITMKPTWKIDGNDIEDNRKARLRQLDNGRAWRYLEENVFPKMRSAYGDAMFVFSHKTSVTEAAPPVVQVQGPRDTVFVAVPSYFDEKTSLLNVSPIDPKYYNRLRGKSFLMGIRTNILAIPLVNLGLEVPFGRHFSLGMDIYYPWLKRNAYHKECTQMVAYGMDIRYWLGRDNVPAEARLLGHSFGIYGAGGHYDFQRNWSGHQGTFFNIGFDWMYAFPIFHGTMHMEIELGLGFIYSKATPYYCYEPYGDCIREPGAIKIVRWYGPTKAQVSIVVPIYRRKK